MGYIAAILFIICVCAGIYLFGYAARKADALFITTLEVVIAIVLLLPIIMVSDRISFFELFTKPHKENWLWLGGAGIFGFIGGNYFSLINLRTAGERINSLLSPAITAVSIITAIIIFNERLTIINVTGCIITLSAVIVFILFKTKHLQIQKTSAALSSSGSVIVCITFTIVFSILGSLHSTLSILHSIWIRLLVALPILLIVQLFLRRPVGGLSPKFFASVAGGVIIQTIISNYLWFYCTFKIGISTFQIIIATLPFFVYTIDVYILKRTQSSFYFLITALLAVFGIAIVMSQPQ